MNTEYELNLLLLPIIAAAIGWITNYIAVKMLFRPKEPINFLFFSVQGVFPKRQKALAQNLGELVSRELFSAQDVVNSIIENSKTPEMVKFIGDKIEFVITEKLPKVIPMLSMVLSPDLVATVKNSFQGELLDMIDGLAHKLSGKLDDKMGIEKVVREKVEAFSSEKLEQILFDIMKKEFRFIELVGAILGFMIGVIQVLLIKWPVLF